MALFIYSFRYLQLARQRYQSGGVFCQTYIFANVKVTINILTVLGSLIYNLYKNSITLSIWIVLAFLSTSYTFFYDIKFDWNLLTFKGRHFLLRPLRIIGDPSIYYVVIFLNLFLRIAWVLTISTEVV